MCIPAVRVSARVPCYRSLEPAVVTTPTVTETRRNGDPVGERMKLAR